jgi:hypothetical protein
MKHQAMWKYIRMMIEAAELPDCPIKDHLDAGMDLLYRELSEGEIAYVNEVSARLSVDL